MSLNASANFNLRFQGRQSVLQVSLILLDNVP
jgi:hypothetical protein